MAQGRKTPLYEWHKHRGARMVDYYGWLMPVEYGEITEEVRITRRAAGLFDVSHMGQFLVGGRQSTAYLDKLLTADVSSLEKGAVRYSPVCNYHGGTVDDIMVYRVGEEKYLLVANAANKEKDQSWLLEHAEEEVRIEDLSGEYALVALQGPKAQEIMEKAADDENDFTKLKPFAFSPQLKVGGAECLVSRTGYTGEDGFELFCAAGEVLHLWEALFEAGKNGNGAGPVGLGARDVLRLEASLPLYGRELDEDITPLEAGLERFISFGKGTHFIGKEALEAQKEKGLTRKLMGVEMLERGVPRSGYPILMGEEEIGHVSSGTHSPTLGKGLGMAFLNPHIARIGEEVKVVIRGKPRAARTVKLPFYRRGKR